LVNVETSTAAVKVAVKEALTETSLLISPVAVETEASALLVSLGPVSHPYKTIEKRRNRSKILLFIESIIALSCNRR